VALAIVVGAAWLLTAGVPGIVVATYAAAPKAAAILESVTSEYSGGPVGASPVPLGAAAQAAEELAARGAPSGSRVFERVVSRAELEATQSSGVLRGGRSGRNFFTNNASLDAKWAQQRLGLDGPLRDFRIRFSVADDIKVSGPGRVPGGQSGTPGGGREFFTDDLTPIDILRVDPLRR